MKAWQRKQERKALQSFVLDLGATSHYVCASDNLLIIGPSNKRVHLPNWQTVNSTAQVALLFDINSEARIEELVPEIKNNSLVSVGKLADAGYTTTFLPFGCGIRVHETKQSNGDTAKIGIQGWREDGGSRLWRIAPLSNSIKNDDGADVMDFVSGAHELCTFKEVSVTEVVGNVYDLPSTEAVIWYLHAALGFPVKATLLKAVRNGNSGSFPGLTLSAVNRYFLESDETQKGHMKALRQGVQSTKDKLGDNDLSIQKRASMKFLGHWSTERMYTSWYQAGRFPITSSRGHKYVMVAVELDGNYIDAEPMTAQTYKEPVRAYETIWECWRVTGVI
ncbi:hypothetical protein ACHAW6_001077 [Cyclotella cf. meneghiniana]